MIAIDTNVILRFVTRDDPDQFRRAVDLIANNDIFVCKTVLLECHWTLLSTYKFTRPQAREGIQAFLGLANVRVEDPEAVHRALDAKTEFADALHLTSMGPATRFATFDRQFIARHGADTPIVFEP